jgi:hypothetical protein
VETGVIPLDQGASKRLCTPISRRGCQADDPNLVFYACLIRDFGATVLPPRDPPPDTGPHTPTEQQGVRIPWGLTASERKKFLQDDLDSLND